MSRGPEDWLFQPEHTTEFQELLIVIAQNSLETQNPIGLVAILRSRTEYLARNLITVGGYDFEGAYEDGWESSYNCLTTALVPTKNSNRLDLVVKLIFEKEDKLFKTEPPLREQIDSPGLTTFYRMFGHIAAGN